MESGKGDNIIGSWTGKTTRIVEYFSAIWQVVCLSATYIMSNRNKVKYCHIIISCKKVKKRNDLHNKEKTKRPSHFVP